MTKEELHWLNDELTALNAQLLESLERQKAVSNDLENVLNSSDVPTLFLDRELKIRFVTPATRTLFNIIPSDVGRPFSDLSKFTVDSDLQADALTVINDGGSIDKEIAAGNGSWYIRRIKPYLKGSGSIEGVVVTFLDMSVQKQIAEDREAARQSAELASQAKSHFLAAASHDLRQPLQTLKLLQDLLEKSVADQQSHTLVKRMEETLNSMSGILNNVLDINQIEDGMVRPRPEMFLLADLLAPLLSEFAFQASAKKLELCLVSSSLAVETDPRLLEQILRNLLSNALKYTPSGKILVGCRRRGATVRLEIWDTGIGIPQDQIENVFNEFHRLDALGGNRERSLGLGLSIVKRLSDLLELNVSVRSQPGKGSAFSVEIRRAAVGHALVSLPQSAKRPASRRNGSVNSILVIEDEIDMRELLKMGLEQLSYIVTVTANADEALEAVQGAKFAPDVILADFNLSAELDGISAIEDVRRVLGRPAPALILTGEISGSALRRYVSKKIPYLHKPVNFAELVNAIEGLPAHLPDWKTPGDRPNGAATSGSRRRIQIIDDEQGVRDSIRSLFEGPEWSVETYISAEDYLAQYSSARENCLIVDAYLPGMSGLELLRLLREKGHQLPVIVITGHSDVGMAVEAMKNGAVDFIEKPFSSEEIFSSVQKALEVSRNRMERSDRREAARAALALLTTRQREILDRIILGQPNKIIAAEIKLSQRTVENHRASIMRRTGSSSLPALLRLVAAAEE
ncbi:response regulator [Neorhizobium lilium]|uniref:histidine kinase n=1 Tax=Neorhizobium lilium TaxID=2503024 RepID=A0A444LKQ2_9HYPH|nr:response regulator [Neorhizobium lilium]RWX80901.1 response regulator [Neorhizobium lilium]